MNATNLYMSTCRLVMQADSDNKESLGELHKLLPYLRQSLTCTVCGRILSNPYTPTETSCQHHVCKVCIGGKKGLKPSCSWCKNYETYIENSQMQLIIKCYKKLCSYVKTSCLYNKLSNGNNFSLGLTDIIDEALSETSSSVLVYQNGPNKNVTEVELPFESSVGHVDNSRPSSSSDLEPDENVVEESDDSRLIKNNSISNSESLFRTPYDSKNSEGSDTIDLKNYTNSESCNLRLSPKSYVQSEDVDCKLEDLDDLELKEELSELNDHKFHRPRPSQILDNSFDLCKSISPLLTVDSSDISPTPLLDSNCNDSLDSTPSPMSSSQDIYEDPIFLETEGDLNLSVEAEQVVVGLDSMPISNFSISVTSPTLTTSVSNSLTLEEYEYRNNICKVINSLPSTSTVTRCVTKVLSTVSTSNPISSTIGIPSVASYNNSRYEMPYSLPSNLLNNVSTTTACQATLSLSDSIISPASVTPSLELSDLSSATSTAITCVLNIPPGTILSNANVKQSSCDPILKHGTSLNNGSSIYSVMYNDCDTTKITIKRKPPDIENIKKFPIENEKLTRIIPPQDIKKAKAKPKPKPKRKGCRCGNATQTPGKLTCCGQRCPCYVEAKACIECQCRGCRNPHRPGGKKVRPIIPQLGNIQIHQIQPVHTRISNITSSLPTSLIHNAHHIGSKSTQTPMMTSGHATQTIRAVHAMHAVQAVHGIGHMHTMPGNVQQLINIGSGMMESSLHPGINIHSNLSLKPVNLALSSIPAQLLINDDKSTSTSASDNSDVDIDI